MENNQQQTVFTCSCDCLKCSFQQRVYCSAQMSRNALDILEDLRERLDRIEKAGAEQGEIFNPMSKEPENESEDLQPEV